MTVILMTVLGGVPPSTVHGPLSTTQSHTACIIC